MATEDPDKQEYLREFLSAESSLRGYIFTHVRAFDVAEDRPPADGSDPLAEVRAIRPPPPVHGVGARRGPAGDPQRRAARAARSQSDGGRLGRPHRRRIP